MRRENQLKQGARLTNSWLLGLRATTFRFILASTSGQIFNAIDINIIHGRYYADTKPKAIAHHFVTHLERYKGAM